MKKKLSDIDKSSRILFLITFFLIVSLAFNLNLFRKFYNILKQDFESRIIKVYGFCGGESVGFLRMIKNKYELKTNPSVINFEINPQSLWAIYDNNIGKNDGSNIIFLNYQKNFKIIFERSNDVFEMQNYYNLTKIFRKLWPCYFFL